MPTFQKTKEDSSVFVLSVRMVTEFIVCVLVLSVRMVTVYSMCACAFSEDDDSL